MFVYVYVSPFALLTFVWIERDGGFLSDSFRPFYVFYSLWRKKRWKDSRKCSWRRMSARESGRWFKPLGSVVSRTTRVRDRDRKRESLRLEKCQFACAGECSCANIWTLRVSLFVPPRLAQPLAPARIHACASCSTSRFYAALEWGLWEWKALRMPFFFSVKRRSFALSGRERGERQRILMGWKVKRERKRKGSLKRICSLS